MASTLHHEEFYRGKDVVAGLAEDNILVCGVGALGSNLVDLLVRQGCHQMWVIDNDRVDEQNVGTQVYGRDDVGKVKVDSLMNKLYMATDAEIGPINKTLDQSNVKRYVNGRDLVVDCFDNSLSRGLLKEACIDVPCVHVGLYADYGEVIWNDSYKVPRDVDGDVCDYPLARNIVMLTVSIAAEVIISFLISGEKRSFTVTLKDLKISRI